MVIIILLFIAGIGIGYLIRKWHRFIKRIEKLTSWSVYALLFLLGLSVGANELVVKNLPLLGLKALAITFGGVAGSIFLSYFVFIKYLKNK